ncbi:NeuD/PglB/VioB family sugar acetyltransferase [Pseudoalteromonas sp. DL-6]|uniref:NeuD/PglB/VioB family sugar acetyltransferase n=1 Tax=Pseudoalteromonas sp. DL-6 TaxID=1390185 RepID=UPI0010C511A3|nr:NeuD/PglB/VioB family sugar acetyltransferase [Pseudoalteromonas sp. DL-6]QBJ61963.1 pilus assembly protein [Pseudoalteromonas sp. DL-6]
MKNKPLVMIGGGGHAAALLEILLLQGRDVIAVVAPEITAGKELFKGIKHFKNDNAILDFSPNEVELVNGIGAMPYSGLRTKIHLEFKSKFYQFATVIANSAHVSTNAAIAQGAQVLTNATICIGSKIGFGTIINTSASIDHDCEIAAFCHIAPGVVMSGQVHVKESVHIGTGAKVINSIQIGKNTIIGVGANVLKTLPDSAIVYGARPYIKLEGKV